MREGMQTVLGQRMTSGFPYRSLLDFLCLQTMMDTCQGGSQVSRQTLQRSMYVKRKKSMTVKQTKHVEPLYMTIMVCRADLMPAFSPIYASLRWLCLDTAEVPRLVEHSCQQSVCIEDLVRLGGLSVSLLSKSHMLHTYVSACTPTGVMAL